MIFTTEQLWLTNLFWSGPRGCISNQLCMCTYGWHKIHIVHSNVYGVEGSGEGSKRPAEATYSQASTLSCTQLAPAAALQIPTEILNLFYKVNKMQIRLCINAMPTSKIHTTQMQKEYQDKPHMRVHVSYSNRKHILESPATYKPMHTHIVLMIHRVGQVTVLGCSLTLLQQEARG